MPANPFRKRTGDPAIDRPLTEGDIARLRGNPLALIKAGYMRVLSSYHITADGKFAINPDGPKSVPFNLRYEQHKIVDYRVLCNKENRATKIIIAKARAAGLSEVASGVIASEMPFFDFAPAIAVSLSPSVQRDVLYLKLRHAISSLPFPTPIKLLNDSDRLIRFDTLSGGTATVSMMSQHLNQGVGVGGRYYWKWLTEYAKYANPEEVMRGLGEATMKGNTTFTIKESTCEGKLNRHFEEFITSWTIQGGRNWFERGYIDKPKPQEAIFFPYYHSVDRWHELPPKVTAMDMYRDLTDYERYQYMDYLKPFAENEMKRLGLKNHDDVLHHCMCQLYWKRGACAGIKEFGYSDRSIPLWEYDGEVFFTKLSMMKEIPLNVEEAFTDDATSAFTEREIEAVKVHVRPPDVVGYLDESGKFLEDPNGWLRLWMDKTEIARNHGFAPSKLFFLGNDVANGDHPEDPKTDFSTMSAWLPCFDGVFVAEQVLEYDTKERTTDFQNKTERVIRFLSGGMARRVPYFCPESAAAGRYLAQYYDADERYQETNRLYYTQKAEQSGLAATKKPGFEPGSRVLNQAAWKYFEGLVVQGKIKVRSSKLVEQLSALIRKTDGTLEAMNKGKAGGFKDDIADAAKLALWHMAQVMEICSGDLSEEADDVDSKGNITCAADPDSLPPYHPDRIEHIRRKREQEEYNQDIWKRLAS
jgi:hypothetical protein